MSDELKHFGIRGMKWGVRRPIGKDGLIRDNSGGKYYTPKDDGDVVIKKSTRINRVSGDPETSSIPGKGYAYASITKRDLNVYASGEAFIRNDYKLSYDLKTNLVSPGEKKRVDAFLEVFKANKEQVSTDMASIAKDYGFIKNKKGKELSSPKDEINMKRALLKMSDKQLQDYGYQLFTTSLDKRPATMQLFIDNLKKKGYNMVIDDNDIINGIAEMPIIVFDRNKSLKQVGVKKLSPQDQDDYYQALGRTPRDYKRKNTHMQREAFSYNKKKGFYRDR